MFAYVHNMTHHCENGHTNAHQLADEEIKLWHVHAMEHGSVMERNTLVIYTPHGNLRNMSHEKMPEVKNHVLLWLHFQAKHTNGKSGDIKPIGELGMGSTLEIPELWTLGQEDGKFEISLDCTGR